MIPIIESNWFALRRYEFFILRLPYIDDAVVDSDSEDYFWSFIGLFLS